MTRHFGTSAANDEAAYVDAACIDTSVGFQMPKALPMPPYSFQREDNTGGSVLSPRLKLVTSEGWGGSTPRRRDLPS